MESLLLGKITFVSLPVGACIRSPLFLQPKSREDHLTYGNWRIANRHYTGYPVRLTRYGDRRKVFDSIVGWALLTCATRTGLPV
jgi:hypothetical protein